MQADARFQCSRGTRTKVTSATPAWSISAENAPCGWPIGRLKADVIGYSRRLSPSHFLLRNQAFVVAPHTLLAFLASGVIQAIRHIGIGGFLTPASSQTATQSDMSPWEGTPCRLVSAIARHRLPCSRF